MKKIFFCLIALSCALICANAQLNVYSTGTAKFTKNISIGTPVDNNSKLNLYHNITSTTSPYYGIKSILKAPTSMPIGDVIGINGHANLSDFVMTSTSQYAKKACGVLGEITMNSTTAPYMFGAAVAGVVNNRSSSYGGIAIYGSINPAYLFPSGGIGLYAGYFAGNTYVGGTLTATLVTTTSDVRYKTNINNIDNKTQSLIYDLKPIVYNLKNDTTLFTYRESSQEIKNQHYGLIAQEVQKVYPNLVYESTSDGMLSINYIELIPILISTIQEQNERISALESQRSSENLLKKQSNSSARLYQNNPNPFNQSTVINYDLPLETTRANIYIYDMTGTEIAAYNITDFGSGSVTISAGNLKAGMYLYSLIADGQIIDTKQMILTK